jgi:hypothetical protein
MVKRSGEDRVEKRGDKKEESGYSRKLLSGDKRMSKDLGNFGVENRGENRAGGTLAKVGWPIAIQLWILGVIAGFFVVRVLGSHTAQRILNSIGAGHAR